MDISHTLKRAVVVGLHLLLLVPVPAFAAYTLGPWTQIAGSPDTWGISASGVDSTTGLNLALSPVADGIASGTATFTFVAQVQNGNSTSGSSTNANVTASNFNALSVNSSKSNAGLQITIGFSTSSTGNPISLQVYQNTTPNQFNTGAISPSDLSGTGTFTPQSINTSDYAVVQFTFTAPPGGNPGNLTTWGHTPGTSTPVNITFTGN
jgi:hypothetical protein